MRFGATYDATKKSLEFPLNPATSSNSGNRDSIETGPTLDGTQLVKGYSVSTWFRADSQAAWEQVWVLGKTGLGKHEGLWLSGSSTVSIHNDAGGGLNYYYPCTSGGNWKHVTFVRKGTTASDHDVYVDGVKVTASTTTGGANVHAFEKDSNLILGENIDRNHYGLDGAISNFKLYDTALTAEEVKTLYDMGRCDEGHHVVNFSKTRVGIGLGDGEAPQGALDVRGDIFLNGFNLIQPRTSIVREDLSVLLDASDRNSFPHFGNTIYDTSGRGRNASARGNISWVNDGQASYFKLPGVNGDYIEQISGSSHRMKDFLMVFQLDTVAASQWHYFISYDTSSDKSLRNYQGGTGNGTTSTADWAQTTTTFYLNGVATTGNLTLSAGTWYVLSGSATNTLFTDTDRQYFFGTGFEQGNRNLTGKIAFVALYDRALSSTEQLQNYRAVSERFGV
jgi:hypothetical protein